jgi:hypothetical protein
MVKLHHLKIKRNQYNGQSLIKNIPSMHNNTADSDPPVEYIHTQCSQWIHFSYMTPIGLVRTRMSL